jgi:WhiB family transcriptional regulator, redox-sensing transcriptional regulator
MSAVLWVDEMDWASDGACVGLDPDLFYPDKADYLDPNHPALVCCRGCPVRTECGEFAIERPSELGIWGGLTWRQRQAIRKARRAA